VRECTAVDPETLHGGHWNLLCQCCEQTLNKLFYYMKKKHIFKNIYLTTSRVKRVHPIWCNGKPVLHTARLLLCSRWSSGDTRLTVLRHRGQQLCITVWTVVQAVLTLTFNSYGDRQISTPYKINTPEPIDKKIGTVDYVREGTLYTKFDTNPPTGCFWANGWNITKIIFYLYLFFSGTRTGQIW